MTMLCHGHRSRPAKYAPADSLMPLLQKLQSRHNDRVKSDPEFQRFSDDITELKAQREKGVVSLNEAERRKELTAREDRLRSREKIGDIVNPGDDDGLQANERSLNADIAMENARKNAKDVLLNEAASILADEADLKEDVRQAATQQTGNRGRK
jgi:carboxyl-terminal processing protease